MKKLMLLIVAFATIGHLHSEETDPSRIIGGDVINIEDAPWQVALFNGNSVRVWCGGIIIHPEFILTARHCIDDLGEDGLRNLNIHAGIRCVDDRNNDTRLRFNTGSIIRHPNYDIVLIRLSTPIIFDDTRQPIGLASPPSMGDVSTSGWGDTKSGMIPGSSRSSCLRSVDLEIISHDVDNSRL
jgi:hypothetical protein